MTDSNKQEKFYFTFGSLDSNKDDCAFPHHGGWVVISSTSEDEARNIFARRYGFTRNGTLRFAFQYTEKQFKLTTMGATGNWGHKEWADVFED